VAGIAGGAILGDGRIGLILDTGGLLALAAKTQTAVAV
jgi:chemotaxis protein histidine kinase CheA